jgi:hypothetical protein
MHAYSLHYSIFNNVYENLFSSLVKNNVNIKQEKKFLILKYFIFYKQTNKVTNVKRKNL